MTITTNTAPVSTIGAVSNLEREREELAAICRRFRVEEEEGGCNDARHDQLFKPCEVRGLKGGVRANVHANDATAKNRCAASALTTRTKKDS